MGDRILVVVVALLMGTGVAGAQKKGTTGGTPGKHSIQGTVQSLSASSLTIKGKDGSERTFTVDHSTKVTAKGGRMKSAKSATIDGKPQLSDLAAIGDQVTVGYVDAGGTARAESIIVTRAKK